MAVKLERKRKLGKQSECVPSSTYSSVIPFAFRSYPPPPPSKKEKKKEIEDAHKKRMGGRAIKSFFLLLLSAFSIYAGSHIQRNICEGEGSAQAVFHSLFSAAELVEGGGWSWRGGGINHNFGLI